MAHYRATSNSYTNRGGEDGSRVTSFTLPKSLDDTSSNTPDASLESTETNESTPLVFTPNCKGSRRKAWKDALLTPNGPLVLAGFVTLLAIVNTSYTILFKIVADDMPNYPYFLCQLTSVSVTPVCFLFWMIDVWARRAPSKWADPTETSPKRIPTIGYPIVMFFVLGALDALSQLLMFMAGPHVSGPLQNLLAQDIILFSLIMSKLVLKRTFLLGHYLGAAVLFSGIAICFLPPLTESAGGAWWWAVIYATNNIPFSISAVYKETAVQFKHYNLNYILSGVNFFTLIHGFSIAPFLYIVGGMDPEDLVLQMTDGFRCFSGEKVRPSGDERCHSAMYPVIAFLVVNVLVTVLVVAVMKRWSGSLGFVAMAVSVPLAEICFTMEMIMGPSKSELSIYDIVGLCLTLAGMFIFGTVDHLRTRRKEEFKAQVESV